MSFLASIFETLDCRYPGISDWECPACFRSSASPRFNMILFASPSARRMLSFDMLFSASSKKSVYFSAFISSLKSRCRYLLVQAIGWQAVAIIFPHNKLLRQGTWLRVDATLQKAYLLLPRTVHCCPDTRVPNYCVIPVMSATSQMKK